MNHATEGYKGYHSDPVHCNKCKDLHYIACSHLCFTDSLFWPKGKLRSEFASVTLRKYTEFPARPGKMKASCSTSSLTATMMFGLVPTASSVYLCYTDRTLFDRRYKRVNSPLASCPFDVLRFHSPQTTWERWGETNIHGVKSNQINKALKHATC